MDEKLLDELEKRNQHPAFQLSFDGIGMHDFLRGVPGTEEKTIAALKLLQKRGIGVSVSMCLHRKNADTIRETIKMLAGLGVSSIKVGSMMSLGEWAQPEVADLQLSTQENLEIIERFIPQYFEDNAPISIMHVSVMCVRNGILSAYVFAYMPDRYSAVFKTLSSSAALHGTGVILLPIADALQKVRERGCEQFVFSMDGIGDRANAFRNKVLSVLVSRECQRLSYIYKKEKHFHE